MPLLTSLFREKRSIENPSTPLSAADDWLYDALGAVRASSGVNVNRETALTYAAWWRGVNLISGDVAKLPVHVYRSQGGIKYPDTEHPAYFLLRRSPNRDMSAFHFRRVMMSHKLSEGNAYAYIDRDGAGRPIELIPLAPHRTYPVRANGHLSYVTELITGEPRKIPAENMLHYKGLSFDGLVGYNVIRKARESLGLGMAFDSYGSILFRNGTSVGVVLEHPGRLSPQSKKNLRESWERMHAGLENSHKTAILEEGMKASKLGMSAKDAQLLDERKFQIREVALWFGVPPHKLGDMSAASYNSLEQENQDYLSSAIDPHLVEIEQEDDRKLLTETQRKRGTHLVEFDRKALIRADMGARAAYYHNGLSDGWLNRDEVRAEEGYNPIPDGDGCKYFMPLNMAPVGGETPPDETPAGQQTPGALLEVPDIRQPDHYSCGACAAMCVGQYFGVGPSSLQEWKDALGTDMEQSTRPMRIVEHLSSLGLVVTSAHNMTLDDLRRFWRAGQPVICPVQDYGPFLPGAATFDYGHYLTVIGASLGYVFAQDSSADNALEGEGSDAAPGRVMIAEQKWLENWHDTDIDGNPYAAFGIAVGRELLPEAVATDALDQPDDEAEGKPGEPIAPVDQPMGAAGGNSPVPVSDTPARQQILDAHQRLLSDVFRRMAKRIGLHARRAAKNPRDFGGWLDTFEAEHADIVTAAFGPVVDALAAVEGRAAYPASFASGFLSRLRADLLDLSGKCTAQGLLAEVDKHMSALESGAVPFNNLLPKE
jgi:HK97 family phage portal protein